LLVAAEGFFARFPRDPFPVHPPYGNPCMANAPNFAISRPSKHARAPDGAPFPFLKWSQPAKL